MLSLLIIPVLYLKYGACDQMDSTRLLDRNPIDVHVIKKAVYHSNDREKPARNSNDYVSPYLIPIDVLDRDHATKKEVSYQLASGISNKAIEKSTKKVFEIDDPDLQPTKESLGEKLKKKSYDYDLDYDQMVKRPSYHFEEHQSDYDQTYEKKPSSFMDNTDRRKKPYHSMDSSTTDTLDTKQNSHVKKLFNTEKHTDLDNQFESDEKDEIHIDVGGSQNPSLEEFLNNYAQKVKHDKYGDKDDYSNDIKAGKGKKSWSLLNSKRHHHPYDDRKGWVSLEPIPWSVSKVSKWQNKYKPTEKPAWHSRPWLDYPETNYAQDDGYKYPTVNSLIDKKKYQVYYMQNNEQNPEPTYNKPSYGHLSHSPHHSYNEDHLQEADCDHRHHNRPHKYNSLRPSHHAYDRDHEPHSLITDGLPANFPRQPHGPSRRLGVPLETSPDEVPAASEEGEWVLLSTTKGYKVPSGGRTGRQLTDVAVVGQPQRGERVMDIGTHRSVRLTVLPPLKGSSVNMTTSHGGLLQVDSTFESVEQARNKLQTAQRRRKKKKPQGNGNGNRPVQSPNRPEGETVQAEAIATMTRTPGMDSGAVLAGVGAGIIPATVAMLVPMALQGKKRRRRRDLSHRNMAAFAF